MELDYAYLVNDEFCDAIEKQGFNISDITKQDDNIIFDISQTSPLGEDWHEQIWVDSDGTFSEAAESFYHYAYEFDYEEAAACLIEMRGTHGIPESITDLIEDASWKKDALSELGDKLFEKFEGRTESLLIPKPVLEIARDYTPKQKSRMVIEENRDYIPKHELEMDIVTGMEL